MTAMFASVNHRDPAQLSERICNAMAATPTLLREVISTNCRRLAAPGHHTRTLRIERLLNTGAYTEAALALIELELPQWQVRRLVYDGGEWHCALSRERELPDWLDQSIEARHHDLALAILATCIEVQQASVAKSRPSVPTVRPASTVLSAPMCCDNFV